MSTPYRPDDQNQAAAGADESDAERTTIVPPVPAPMAFDTGPLPVNRGNWANYAPPDGRDDPAMTSVLPAIPIDDVPPGPPEPPGYPVAPPPPLATSLPAAALPVVALPASRVGPAFLTALVGLLFTAGGLVLAAKYGVAAATDRAQSTVAIKNSVLACVGAVLLLGAVVLNGWSPWATVIPGLALTAAGGWALFDSSAAVRLSRWTRSVLPGNQLTVWHVTGFTLIVGLIMLGASIAAAMARASGKRDGRLLGLHRR